ncbi:MAG: efflux RND transporter permease subunit, partial [Verrucomicrobiales bacterium]|nr:efflux RND transporter permease subunit [Verrucomicrobiales bacterium]
VTHFAGAGALKLEDLVTKKLEEKIDELESIEEITSQSRPGVSVITVKLRPDTEARVQQEWDKLRAKLREVTLPEGCGTPNLDTDFGNTLTLLFALVSPPPSEAETKARANIVRARLAEMRAKTGAEGRAAALAFFPPTISESYCAAIRQKFETALALEKIGEDVKTAQTKSFIVVDFKTRANRADIQRFIGRFTRALAGSENEPHPDGGPSIVLMGDEDPLPALQAAAMPRYNYRELERAAETLEDEVKQVPSVGRVRKIGNVTEEVDLLFSVPVLNGFKFTGDEVLNAISSRNAIIPGGTFRAEGQNFPVQLSGEFKNEDELLGTVVGVTKDGNAAYLRDVFEVRRGYENPIPYNVEVLHRPSLVGADVRRLTTSQTCAGNQSHLTSAPTKLRAARSVLLAIEMKEGNIIGQFNHNVRGVLDLAKARLPEGVEIVTLSDQPASVAHRIHHFMKCFIEAVVVVVLVALFLMDWRSALVVATAIPLTVAMTFGGMALLGIPLHQISIAALIIALGMLVDDPVVASDAINRELAHGQPRGVAAWFGPYRLRHAIFFGTIINIVAFLPLALLPGDKGAYIFALPIVVTLALVSSRLVSMTFIPLLAYYLLRGQKGMEAGGEMRSFFLFKPVDKGLIAVLPRYKRLLQAALRRPFRAVGIAYGLLVASFGLTVFFGSQFFPPAERNQLLIDIELPESASLLQTRSVCQRVTEILKRHEAIQSAAVFAGGTAPRFFITVSPKENAPYLAQVLVVTRHDDDVLPLIVKLRAELDREIVGARCIVKQLEQGPPVESPIQVRLIGDDLDGLRAKADEVAQAVRAAGGYKVHDDLGRRMPVVQIDIDQERANTLGIQNSQVGRIAQAAFAGVKVTELREGDHLVPVKVRLRIEERNEADKIRTLYVRSLRDQLVPLDSFASVNLKPEYATISHFNKMRSVTVKSFSTFGELPSEVLARARKIIDRIQLPPGCKLEYAGEDKELKKSKEEIGRVMLISLALITLAMVIQFNSVTKSLVVMLTVPLGLIGAFVGIVAMQTSLGFMAFIGIMSLAGVVVSHIIVLSDFIEEARAEGMELKEALVQAGLVRLRAVLVTVLATVGGLIPLALTGGELWRPLTAVHIFGLLFATSLTLVALPVLYYIFCAKLRWIK